MPSEDILRKVIEKAVDNGYKGPYVGQGPTETIFSHEFARAFWGEHKVCNQCGTPYEGTGLDDCDGCKSEDVGDQRYALPFWQYHLQQLALAEGRLAYLEKFL